MVMLNEAQADGVFRRYAIGGVGATFYLEPVATIDLDVFIVMDSPQDQGLVSPEPVYRHFLGRGATIQGEHLLV